MTLKQIAAEMDALIGRLSKARAILATLAPQDLPAVEELTRPHREVEAVPAASPASESVPAEPPPPAVRRRRSVAARTPRAPRRRPQQPASTALRGSIPKGPVAVSAADAVRQRTSAEPPPRPAVAAAPKAPGNSLDDLVREISRRTGALDAGLQSHP